MSENTEATYEPKHAGPRVALWYPWRVYVPKHAEPIRFGEALNAAADAA